MGHNEPVLRPRCIRSSRDQFLILFYSILLPVRPLLIVHAPGRNQWWSVHKLLLPPMLSVYTVHYMALTRLPVQKFAEARFISDSRKSKNDMSSCGIRFIQNTQTSPGPNSRRGKEPTLETGYNV